MPPSKPTQASAGAFLKLFNDGVDYVKYNVSTGLIAPCKTNVGATHTLICTQWNVGSSATNPIKRRRENKTKPRGHALSVCAVPLRRRDVVSTHKLRTPIIDSPVYKRNGSLAGKRAVLSQMVQNHATPSKMVKLIRVLPNIKLDALYRSLLRANRRLRRKHANTLRAPKQ